ncbi:MULTISPECIES: biliverdin-producing heme oxygenase [Methylobacterium]|uniref:Heme oxygenase n=1 Tax=Methylobacterium jeotgali TaxID=381630 RepID=A0ABQ4SRP1_9HYPH|nr:MULTISPECIES: biliverdin-producing heme oxygenase [Methylobacterium]PIU07706.1 MAG: biliverdin-producing heme oxygenase [Methylobacterium sp. CG09_land_8_20_14_0_10_71_15]PIU11409.1 MAG: biliverdin-producing heme oxygenase [Methylobacterium sp. CG08_land_8_20_14_0_20_71_15]GBU18586.1 heme oxygenase [Methylobacterium sp.]GJE05128.1 hypothetical protein AOPFMNJM_0425 [Methylobacterium jeotgali]
MSLRHRLREETAAPHEALERDLDWQARVASLDGYRDLLARLRGFHATLEPEIAGALGDDAFLDPRRRIEALDADLACLGLTPAAVEALPRPQSLGLAGPDEALGALYVFEGSTLGGILIGRHVRALHGLSPEEGCAYYAGRGERAGPMWRSFCERLDAVGETPGAAEAVSAGAARTFRAMRDWLCADVAAAGLPPAA